MLGLQHRGMVARMDEQQTQVSQVAAQPGGRADPTVRSGPPAVTIPPPAPAASVPHPTPEVHALPQLPVTSRSPSPERRPAEAVPAAGAGAPEQEEEQHVAPLLQDGEGEDMEQPQAIEVEGGDSPEVEEERLEPLELDLPNVPADEEQEPEGQ